MLKIPLSLIGSAEQFTTDVEQHIEALTAHLMGEPDQPAPRASHFVEAVIHRKPQDGHPAERGPDTFEALPYEIVDDTPKPEPKPKAPRAVKAKPIAKPQSIKKTGGKRSDRLKPNNGRKAR